VKVEPTDYEIGGGNWGKGRRRSAQGQASRESPADRKKKKKKRVTRGNYARKRNAAGNSRMAGGEGSGQIRRGAREI